MPPRKRSYRFPRPAVEEEETDDDDEPPPQTGRRPFGPNDLHNWAFAIMVALLFVSCGVKAAADAYAAWRDVSEKIEKAD
jgi:hypothetical protein